MEEELFTRLTTYAGLAALIGLRAYPTRLPQASTLPAIVYTVIDGVPVELLRTESGTFTTRVQITAFAATYAAAKGVAREVHAALARYRGTTIRDINADNTGGDFYDDQAEQYQVVADYLITHT